MLLLFMTANKVLSPQYVIWLLPHVPLLPGPAVVIGFILVTLTLLMCSIAYPEMLLQLDPLAVAPVNVRNVLTVGRVPTLVCLPAGARGATVREVRDHHAA